MHLTKSKERRKELPNYELNSMLSHNEINWDYQDQLNRLSIAHASIRTKNYEKDIRLTDQQQIQIYDIMKSLISEDDGNATFNIPLRSEDSHASQNIINLQQQENYRKLIQNRISVNSGPLD